MDSFEHRAEDERLEDRIRVLNGYPFDFLLLRYHQEGGASRAAAVSNVPVINAGDGVGQHPTQALLDVYTFWREHGRMDCVSLSLAICPISAPPTHWRDVQYGAAVRSPRTLIRVFRDPARP